MLYFQWPSQGYHSLIIRTLILRMIVTTIKCRWSHNPHFPQMTSAWDHQAHNNTKKRSYSMPFISIIGTSVNASSWSSSGYHWKVSLALDWPWQSPASMLQSSNSLPWQYKQFPLVITWLDIRSQAMSTLSGISKLTISSPPESPVPVLWQRMPHPL